MSQAQTIPTHTGTIKPKPHAHTHTHILRGTSTHTEKKKVTVSGIKNHFNNKKRNKKRKRPVSSITYQLNGPTDRYTYTHRYTQCPSVEQQRTLYHIKYQRLIGVIYPTGQTRRHNLRKGKRGRRGEGEI